MTGPTGCAAEARRPDDIESSIRCSGALRGLLGVCRHPFRHQGSLRDAGTEGDPLGRLVPRATIRPSCPHSPFGRTLTPFGARAGLLLAT